jgi:hypothetical protein
MGMKEVSVEEYDKINKKYNATELFSFPIHEPPLFYSVKNNDHPKDFPEVLSYFWDDYLDNNKRRYFIKEEE